MQYVALLETENVKLKFLPDAAEETTVKDEDLSRYIL